MARQTEIKAAARAIEAEIMGRGGDDEFLQDMTSGVRQEFLEALARAAMSVLH